jgi:hypothetical protein
VPADPDGVAARSVGLVTSGGARQQGGESMGIALYKHTRCRVHQPVAGSAARRACLRGNLDG